MKRFVFLLFISIFMMSACGDKEVEPVSINEETDKCVVCNMAVGDNQFATQVVLESGKTYVFDDVGCMYEWLHGHTDAKIAGAFVRDYDSKEWIESNKATYVYDQKVKTPMAYNVISFAKKEDAKKYINENQGNLMSYDDLENHQWPVNEEMKKMNKMKHNSGMDSSSKHSHSDMDGEK